MRWIQGFDEQKLLNFCCEKNHIFSVSHQWCDHFYRLLYSSTRHIEKVEGGERDTQLVHVNEANSCSARGYSVSQATQGE
jgi:hypothetical protein